VLRRLSGMLMRALSNEISIATGRALCGFPIAKTKYIYIFFPFPFLS